VHRSVLENGYAGLICVVLVELLVSAAVVAATMNKLGKGRRADDDTKTPQVDLETGKRSAGP
jgi:hypothetical protein